MTNVVIVNYGMGNIKSVMRGVEKVGAKVTLSNEPETVLKADRVILPGVGAFDHGMSELRKRNLEQILKDYVKTERPLLGICLGMQMLFDSSKEHGEHKGLGFIPGQVIQIPQDIDNTTLRKIPHIGWNALQYPPANRHWDQSILGKTEEGDSFYFVHSFMAQPENSEYILAQCLYEELPINAVVKKDNITGCQFHPEKSGPSGLKILEQFIS